MGQARRPVWNHVDLLWHRCGIIVEFYSLICSQISSARLTMRHDEVTVNQEADDHHRSCSCPCSRHRGTKSPKHQITEAPKQCRSASCSCRCLLTVNRSKNLVVPRTAAGGSSAPRKQHEVGASNRSSASNRRLGASNRMVLRCFGASNRGKSKSGGGHRPLG
jgi:Tfp pilus assembly protein PilX